MVEAKKMVNGNIEKIILAVNKKKDDLLKQIDDIHNEHKNKYDEKLSTLNQMKEICKFSKGQFDSISTDDQISKTERMKKLQKLLTMNVNNTNEGEEKINEDNYDNYKIIGSELVIPGKMVVTFDEEIFGSKTVHDVISLLSKEVKQKWNTKKSYSVKSNWEGAKLILSCVMIVLGSIFFAYLESLGR